MEIQPRHLALLEYLHRLRVSGATTLPTHAAVARELDIAPEDVRSGYRVLHRHHLVVLDQGERSFSTLTIGDHKLTRAPTAHNIRPPNQKIDLIHLRERVLAELRRIAASATPILPPMEELAKACGSSYWNVARVMPGLVADGIVEYAALRGHRYDRWLKIDGITLRPKPATTSAEHRARRREMDARVKVMTAARLDAPRERVYLTPQETLTARTFGDPSPERRRIAPPGMQSPGAIAAERREQEVVERERIDAANQAALAFQRRFVREASGWTP